MRAPAEENLVIHTIGHSTRPISDFIAVLQAHGITKLIDIRTVPRSRTNPQFNRDTLPGELAKAGIAYEHMPALGGLRKPAKDSSNTGWKNASFRGYADYMQTRDFAAAIDALIEQAKNDRVCVMCAEALPWRCHRSLVADALTARGIRAIHIMSAQDAHPHHLTGFARVNGTKVTYPGEAFEPG